MVSSGSQVAPRLRVTLQTVSRRAARDLNLAQLGWAARSRPRAVGREERVVGAVDRTSSSARGDRRSSSSAADEEAALRVRRSRRRRAWCHPADNAKLAPSSL